MSQEYKFILKGVEQNTKNCLELIHNSISKIGFSFNKSLGFFDIKTEEWVKSDYHKAKKNIIENEGGKINYFLNSNKYGHNGSINFSIFFALSENWVSISFDDSYTGSEQFDKNKNIIRTIILSIKKDLNPKVVDEGYFGLRPGSLGNNKLGYLNDDEK